ncbi:MAG: SAM-dependent chlorinase/fluorinase [Proteobacteria bacterium]|nr:SAM-dependent chlorinase/fluorinase [Pseudomonadota bacterium]
MQIITLLTDFGLKDPYVGIMKGVIFSINPDLTIIDITHNVSPQDIREGAFLMKEYYPYFKNGTCHVAVIDPTVGSTRRPIVFSKDEHYFVGPDNGIFSHIIERNTDVYEIKNRDFILNRISSTFHGRDIFAPVAAHLASGVHPSAFGPKIVNPVYLADIFPDIINGVLTGEVVMFDRFGNAITNIDFEIFNDFITTNPFKIHIGNMTFSSINQSYYEQNFTCLINSSGYIEFGCYMGSFAKEAGIKKKDTVRVQLL